MLALMSPRRGVALVRKRAKPSCRAQSAETVTQTLKLFKHFFKVFVITSTRFHVSAIQHTPRLAARTLWSWGLACAQRKQSMTMLVDRHRRLSAWGMCKWHMSAWTLWTRKNATSVYLTKSGKSHVVLPSSLGSPSGSLAMQRASHFGSCTVERFESVRAKISIQGDLPQKHPTAVECEALPTASDLFFLLFAHGFCHSKGCNTKVKQRCSQHTAVGYTAAWKRFSKSIHVDWLGIYFLTFLIWLWCDSRFF